MLDKGGEQRVGLRSTVPIMDVEFFGCSSRELIHVSTQQNSRYKRLIIVLAGYPFVGEKKIYLHTLRRRFRVDIGISEYNVYKNMPDRKPPFDNHWTPGVV